MVGRYQPWPVKGFPFWKPERGSQAGDSEERDS
jgi:hypothetical protein